MVFLVLFLNDSEEIKSQISSVKFKEPTSKSNNKKEVGLSDYSKIKKKKKNRSRA